MERNSLGLAKKPQDTKVCVAMSGGVDSSAAAVLLMEQGYDVFGLTMDLLQPPYAPVVSSIADAAVVAQKLGIPHEFLDMKSEFRQEVIDYFTSSYEQGKTPSPCILCNRAIKLGKLAEEAKKRGADVIITGHYANIKLTEDGVELHKGTDQCRDQSYFLFAVQRQFLQMLRCPLAELSKDQTREIARKAGLEVAAKHDSQDICFVSNGKYGDLIRQLRNDKANLPGEIIHTDGRILGQHQGIINYTIGQRRGLGIGSWKGRADHDALYVVALDALNNRVIVGSESDLYQKEIMVRDVNWLIENPPRQAELTVKLRSRSPEVAVRAEFSGDRAILHLPQAFAAAAPGQGCCFYEGTRVVGGGFIDNNNFFQLENR